MLTRISRITAATACCLLTAIGLLALPALAWISTFLALLIGSLAAIRAHSTHPDIPDAARTGITAAAVTAAAGLVAAGVIALLGPVAASVIPLLFGAAGAWAWHHRRGSGGHTDTRKAGPGTAMRHHAAGPGQTSHTAPQPPRLPMIHTGRATAAELRAAWQRSYWLLHDLPPAPVRCEMADLRQRLLDELERRDPQGLRRWLQNDPRAGSDPGRYLTANHQTNPRTAERG
jgi:hypothetical protein